jgi:hypothetical protein
MIPKHAAARGVKRGRSRERCHAGINRSDASIVALAEGASTWIGGLS